ncbi:hypothetical protein [Cetobacterium sp.]|uniref:hypothetical protein n=1 Tax=Cetobacterium sp. TaxID=2071632 RepID=UPI0025F08955|nr:hypothetical protein [uncultured Cetobacterium sp.]
MKKEILSFVALNIFTYIMMAIFNPILKKIFNKKEYKQNNPKLNNGKVKKN